LNEIYNLYRNTSKARTPPFLKEFNQNQAIIHLPFEHGF
jgi:hypothetical protein